MELQLTYREMAYARHLLHKDTPSPSSIDAESNESLQRKIQSLEKMYTEELTR